MCPLGAKLMHKMCPLGAKLPHKLCPFGSTLLDKMCPFTEKLPLLRPQKCTIQIPLICKKNFYHGLNILWFLQDQRGYIFLGHEAKAVFLLN